MMKLTLNQNITQMVTVGQQITNIKFNNHKALE